jgi:stress response protein SCP2
MTLFTGPRLGNPAPFTIPDIPPGAFTVGLSWNEKAPPAAGLRAALKRLLGASADDDGPDEHDLDLYGYVFDDANRLKAVVGPDENSLSDISGAVFHSGDDTTGGDGGETITVQTHSIPEDYRHFFFLVRSAEDLRINEVGGVRMRLTAAEAESSTLNNPVSPPGHVRARGYVFCHVARGESGWTCRSLDAFTDFEENWGELLASLNKLAAPS